MWGAKLFQFLTFFPNLVNNKMSNFVKVSGNEGHHHLTFDIWLVKEFSCVYRMNFKLCVLGVHRLVRMSSMEIYKYFLFYLKLKS